MPFHDLIITAIDSIQTVSRVRGHSSQITGRKSYGLSFCLGGRITYFHKEKSFVSVPGYAVFLPKGQSYTSETDRSGQFPLINFQCEEPPSDTILVVPLQNAEQCLAEFEAIKKLFLLPHNRLRVMELFYSILGQIAVCQSAGASQLSSALQYLEDHLSDPALSNAALASQVGFSEVYFRRLFVQQFGTPPHQYIVELRLRRAKQLLSDGFCSVTSIAEQCGFSSVYHFSRCFREQTGLTPTEYSRQNRISKI